MPQLYSRVDVHLPRETKVKLERLKEKMRRKGLKNLSNSKIIAGIVEQFLEREKLVDDDDLG